MKRNNVFMWSYIIFIFISFIVRFFYNYPMWSKLVVAITITSFLFSIADIFSILYSSSNERVDTYKPLLSDAVKRHTKIKQQFEKLTKRTKFSNDINIEDFDRNMEKVNSIFDKLQSNLEYAELKNKIFKVIFIFCTFFGFLSFFCTMTFEVIAECVIKIQEYISIIAFAFILMAQQYSAYATKKLNKEIDLFKKTFESSEEIERLLSELEVNYAD